MCAAVGGSGAEGGSRRLRFVSCCSRCTDPDAGAGFEAVGGAPNTLWPDADVSCVRWGFRGAGSLGCALVCSSWNSASSLSRSLLLGLDVSLAASESEKAITALAPGWRGSSSSSLRAVATAAGRSSSSQQTCPGHIHASRYQGCGINLDLTAPFCMNPICKFKAWL